MKLVITLWSFCDRSSRFSRVMMSTSQVGNKEKATRKVY